MKAHFNLSEIMTNAHKLFKSQRTADRTFADCLREAWKAAKQYVGRSIRMIWMWGNPSVIVQETAEYAAGVAAYYNAGTNGRTYFGD